MRGVNNRGSRPTRPFDAQALAHLSEQAAAASGEAGAGTEDATEDDALEEWNELADSKLRRIASGTTPPEGTRIRSRTSTVHDPLTTSLLAEVARAAEIPDEESAAHDKKPAK
jgi:hypothetical protein